MVQIFYSYITKDKHELLLKKIIPGFSNDFQKKNLRYRRWQDAQSSLLGRMLLDNGLSKLNKELDIKNLHYTSYNKPYFEGEKVKFNISHSGDIVVCAISEIDEIGIDIEIIQDIEIENFKQQMTNIEWQRVVSSSNIKNAFFEYWTQKEAVMKSHGNGLSIPLKSFEIHNGQTKIEEDVFFLKEIQLDKNYKCHIALKNKIGPIDFKSKLVNFFY